MGYNPKTGEFTTETKIFPSLAMKYGMGDGLNSSAEPDLSSLTTTTIPPSSGLGSLTKAAAGATAVGAIGQLGLGIYQYYNQRRLAREFDKQKKAMFSDSIGPLQENKSMYQRQERLGLSPEATALARSTSANQMAGQFRAATDLGGGQLGSALGRIGALSTNQLGLNLGLQDQQARERARAGIASVNRELSQVERMDIQRKQRMEDLTMQELAGMRQDSVQNIAGALGSIPTGLSNLAYIQALTNKTV